ncbi:MAG: hypothetical protein FWB93_01625 [Oscillospiraceae bacterium]|nr:hypothetical protein [Oscillospiraceae bacterium]
MSDKATKTTINILYFFGILTIIALIAYAEYCARSWSNGVWNGIHGVAPPIPFLRHFLQLEPFNVFVSIALAAGSIPMSATTILFGKYNNISEKRYSRLKKTLMWIPAGFCVLMVIHVILRVIINIGFALFW